MVAELGRICRTHSYLGYFWFIMATLEEVVTQVRLLTEAQRQLENQLLQ